MAITFRDRYKTTLTEAPATTEDFSIGIAAEQFHTFGGQDDGLEFDIVVVDTNDEWEIREYCTYNHANKQLTRGTLVDSSTGGVINLSASAILAVTLLAKRVPTSGSSGTVTEVTTSAPLNVSNGTTTPSISIAQATTSTSGYLSSTDWNTFNGKQAALGFTPYNVTNPAGYTSNLGTVTTVTANGPLTVTNSNTTPALTIDQASSSTSGYLSSTDWNTFNAKLSSVPVATATVSGTIKVGTGLVITNGVLSSTDVGGTVTTVTGNGPLTVTNPSTTPSISIAQATTSTSGYLSSTDWNTFNSKLGTLPIATTNDLGGVKVDGTSITITQDGTLSAAAATSTSVVRQLVKNGSGVALTKGQAVYITGADGTNVLIGLASNSSEQTSSKTLGLLAQDLAVNASGYVITEGVLAGLDTSTATIGNPVWLGSTAGSLIFGLANKPVAPNHLVYIGVVSRVNQNNGEIFIKVQNGFELSTEMHDVLCTTLANNDLLVWESATSLWKNKQLASGQVTTALGFTPYNATNPAGYTTNTGSVTSVSGSGPISVATGTTTPAISISQATTSTSGYLSSTDWNTFNNKLSSVPVASATVSGTVKVGTGLVITNGVLSTPSTGASIRPSLLLDFANSKTLDSRITFTRASTATYTGADGLIKNAASGEARFDHNPTTGASLGLLIEEQRSNLLQYTETYGAASNYWISYNVALLPNATIAPDGLSTACKVVESKDSVAQNHYTGKTIPLNLSTRYAMSVYLKAGETTVVCLTVGGDSFDGGGALYVDLSNGTVITRTGSATADNSGIIPVGNGWYRCYITPTTGSSGANHRGFLVIPCTGSSTNANYIGNGTSGFYIWGAQLEQGAFATSYIPSADTFTSRASTATYYGSDGLVKTAATNVARYSYNPSNLGIAGKLLLEPAATNLLTYSENFDNAVWSKSNATVTANATTAPDGTLTADKHVESTAYGAHSSVQVFSVVSGNTYTASYYVKSGERTEMLIGFDITTGFANYQYGSFNLVTGVATTFLGSPILSITAAGNGWYRCSVTATATGTSSNAQVSTQIYNGTTNVYTGNGTSGIYIWGAQLETGNTATSYIPTTSAQVTRAADVSSSAQATRAADKASMTGTNFSSWYRQDEGSFIVNTNVVGTRTSDFTSIRFDDSTSNNRIQLSTGSNATIFNPFIVTSGTVQGNNIVSISPIGNTISDFSYQLNYSIASVNGTLGTADTTVSVPSSISRAIIGADTTVSYLNGTIAKIAYYPKRLSNAELQSITTQ